MGESPCDEAAPAPPAPGPAGQEHGRQRGAQHPGGVHQAPHRRLLPPALALHQARLHAAAPRPAHHRAQLHGALRGGAAAGHPQHGRALQGHVGRPAADDDRRGGRSAPHPAAVHPVPELRALPRGRLHAGLHAGHARHLHRRGAVRPRLLWRRARGLLPRVPRAAEHPRLHAGQAAREPAAHGALPLRLPHHLLLRRHPPGLLPPLVHHAPRPAVRRRGPEPLHLGDRDEQPAGDGWAHGAGLLHVLGRLPRGVGDPGGGALDQGDLLRPLRHGASAPRGVPPALLAVHQPHHHRRPVPARG
mmetsp:Transcript_4684/g.13775  ORF Transcript_4684/g.13775 Transcript_4684/m.13775 type:complete len:303 (-) Transcript_4684:599-1507(-)